MGLCSLYLLYILSIGMFIILANMYFLVELHLKGVFLYCISGLCLYLLYGLKLNLGIRPTKI